MSLEGQKLHDLLATDKSRYFAITELIIKITISSIVIG